MKIKHLDIYCGWLFDTVPHEVYVVLLIIFCVGTVLFLRSGGTRRGLRFSLRLLFVEYIILLYASTIFFRPMRVAVGINLIPLWSYRSYLKGEDLFLMPENIMNVVAFVPIGLLLGLIFRTMSWIKVLAIGACLSVGIEMMQFVLKRGFAEFDDVMHNTAGCLIGYGIYMFFSVSAKRLSLFFTTRKKDLVS